MKSFRDSNEAALRRIVRDAIRRGPFTAMQRDVVLAILNHWFHHKSGPKPFIHPSRAMIAKRSNCTIKTVSRTMGILRTSNILVAKSNLICGKGKSVQYQVNLYALFTLCGMDWVDAFASDKGANVPFTAPQMSRLGRDKMSHCLMMSDGVKELSQEMKHE